MPPRLSGAALALVAALLLALSALTAGWWRGHPTVGGHTREAQTMLVGLYSAELCNTGGDGTCRSVDLDTGFTITAYVELGAAGLGLVLALALAALTWKASDARKAVAKALLAATALAALVAIALLVQGPTDKGSIPVGFGLYVFFGGAVAAVAASLVAPRPPPPLRLATGTLAAPSALPSLPTGVLEGMTVRSADVAALRYEEPPAPAPMYAPAAVRAPKPPPLPVPLAMRAAAEKLPVVDGEAFTVAAPMRPSQQPGAMMQQPQPSSPFGPPPSHGPGYAAPTYAAHPGHGEAPSYTPLPSFGPAPVVGPLPFAPPPVVPPSFGPPSGVLPPLPPIPANVDEPPPRARPPTAPPPLPPMLSKPPGTAPGAKPATRPPPMFPPPRAPIKPATLPPPIAGAGAGARPVVPMPARPTAPRVAVPAVVPPAAPPEVEATIATPVVIGDSTSPNVPLDVASAEELDAAADDMLAARTEAGDVLGGADYDDARERAPTRDELEAADRLGSSTDVSPRAPEDPSVQQSGGHAVIGPPLPVEPLSVEGPTVPSPPPKVPISTAPDSLPPPKSSTSSGPSPACPQCEAPMAWVEEHLRFYCKSCRMYF